jgi:hypothetical protein
MGQILGFYLFEVATYIRIYIYNLYIYTQIMVLIPHFSTRSALPLLHPQIRLLATYYCVNFCCYSAVHTMMFWTGQKHVTGKFENSISLNSWNFTTPTGT